MLVLKNTDMLLTKAGGTKEGQKKMARNDLYTLPVNTPLTVNTLEKTDRSLSK